MVLTLFGDGLVGDLHVAARSIALRRTGLSRYVLDAHEAVESISVEIWTTRRATLEIDGHEPPNWVRIATDDGEITSVEAESCGVHFEHLERSAYILIVSRPGTDEGWRAVVRAQGYVKTRVLAHRPTAA